MNFALARQSLDGRNPSHCLSASPIAVADLATDQCSPVGLLNTYSSRNLGDAAIITAIRELSGVTDVRANITDEVPVHISGLSYSSNLSDCKRFVSVGGDIFNNARPNFLTRNFVSNVHQLRTVADRTIVFGQTIPSSCGWLGLPVLASALRRTRAVVVRDEESFDILKRFGVKVELSHDAAFALSPTDLGIRSAEQLFAKQELVADKTVLLSVRSFDSIYPHDQEQFQKSMTELSSRLLDRGHQVAVMIQSDVNDRDSDRTIAKQLQQATPGLKIIDFLDDANISNSVETLLGALAIAKSVVAVRYHAAVLRMAGGRQPYHLFYSRKGRALHKRHSLTGGALDDFDPIQAVSDIEELSDREFRPDPLRQHVVSSFTHAFEQLA